MFKDIVFGICPGGRYYVARYNDDGVEIICVNSEDLNNVVRILAKDLNIVFDRFSKVSLNAAKVLLREFKDSIPVLKDATVTDRVFDEQGRLTFFDIAVESNNLPLELLNFSVEYGDDDGWDNWEVFENME